MNGFRHTTLRQARTAQVFIVLMFLPTALLYLVFPPLAIEVGNEMGVPHLVVPYTLAFCVAVAAIHVFLFAVWKIVGFIKTADFYSMPVTRWVKVAKSLVIVGCLAPIVVGLHLLLVEHAGGPLLVPFVFGVITVAVAASALLDLLVGLYREASANVAELAEVI